MQAASILRGTGRQKFPIPASKWLFVRRLQQSARITHHAGKLPRMTFERRRANSFAAAEDEAEVFGEMRAMIRLFTSAATILKQALQKNSRTGPRHMSTPPTVHSSSLRTLALPDSSVPRKKPRASPDCWRTTPRTSVFRPVAG